MPAEIPADVLRAAAIAVEETYGVERGYAPDAEFAERLARAALEAAAWRSQTGCRG